MIGIQKCHLFIFDSNIEGIRFWEKIGWIRREDIGVVSKEIDFKKPGDADR
jgi:putative acetyltransferase